MTSWRIARAVPVLILSIGLAACGSGAGPSASVAPSAVPSAIELATSPAEASVAPSPTAEPSVAGTNYVVRKGDTLVSIAAKHHVTLEALRAANPQVTDPRKLQIGQKLTIPS